MKDENDGCKCQEEPQNESPNYTGSGSLTWNPNLGLDNCDTESRDRNKIHKVLIEQMDYGYLVKAGCQTLCVETKKNLITLFTEYINDPRRVRSLYDANDLSRLYEEADLDERIPEIEKQVVLPKQKDIIDIAVIGKTIDDVMNYLRDIVPAAVKTGNGMRKYVVETQEVIMVYYVISTVEHTRGMEFDKVVETHRARENQNFHEIMDSIQSTRR